MIRISTQATKFVAAVSQVLTGPRRGGVDDKAAGGRRCGTSRLQSSAQRRRSIVRWRSHCVVTSSIDEAGYGLPRLGYMHGCRRT